MCATKLYPCVTIALLIKDKQTTLPDYLQCIYHQTYPKRYINLYIRTNDNKDDSETILREFIDKHGSEYKKSLF